MFLATTADQRFWKTDEPILFLGEWCKLYSQKVLWGKIPHEVLPYHWDDREKFNRDCHYVAGVYENALHELAHWLNKTHHEDHDIRYWRLIIGPWLLYFIQIFFDRYSSIEEASQSGKVSLTRIGRYNPTDFLPRDCVDFTQGVSTDEYNQFLYSWLIENTPGLPYEYIDQNPGEKGVKVEADGTSWQKQVKRILKRGILFYEKNIPYRFNQISLVSSYLGTSDLFRLQFSLGQWPSLYSPQVHQQTAAMDQTLRDQISLGTTGNRFEGLLAKIIGRQIPSLYIEGYDQMKKAVATSYINRPKVILTANDFYDNEGFKFWVAGCVEQGTKFAGMQHGGNYGTALFNTFEDHETMVSDRYYTWGWQSDEMPNTRPLAAAKLNSCRKLRHDPAGKILLTLMVLPRYSYYLYSLYVSSTGQLAYYQDQFAFINNLSEPARKLLLVRLYKDAHQWEDQKRWADEFPDLEYDPWKKPFLERLRASRLFIGTCNSTTFLESFVAECPTILYWNPRHWELRESAKPYFDRLKAVGIMHDSPQSAAAKVNDIFTDPDAWWHTDEVQEAKNEFCSRFALTSEEWLVEWRRELLDLALQAN